MAHKFFERMNYKLQTRRNQTYQQEARMDDYKPTSLRGRVCDNAITNQSLKSYNIPGHLFPPLLDIITYHFFHQAIFDCFHHSLRSTHVFCFKLENLRLHASQMLCLVRQQFPNWSRCCLTLMYRCCLMRYWVLCGQCGWCRMCPSHFWWNDRRWGHRSHTSHCF